MKKSNLVSTCQHCEFLIQNEAGTLISLLYSHTLAYFQQVSRLYQSVVKRTASVLQ